MLSCLLVSSPQKCASVLGSIAENEKQKTKNRRKKKGMGILTGFSSGRQSAIGRPPSLPTPRGGRGNQPAASTCTRPGKRCRVQITNTGVAGRELTREKNFRNMHVAACVRHISRSAACISHTPSSLRTANRDERVLYNLQISTSSISDLRNIKYQISAKCQISHSRIPSTFQKAENQNPPRPSKYHT